LNASENLKQDHLIVRRLGIIAQQCSNKLSANNSIPIEDIEILSVVIQEFVDRFHHGKEEKAYFPQTRDKNTYSEDIRKFLIEHELGRRIANMLSRSIMEWRCGINSREPVARYLKAYSVFITDHTGKEDKFFDLIEDKGSLSEREHLILIEHYKRCQIDVGGKFRMEQLIKMLEFLENTEWMRVK
jgi:hemerythrin-like domain-containing protein